MCVVNRNYMCVVNRNYICVVNRIYICVVNRNHICVANHTLGLNYLFAFYCKFSHHNVIIFNLILSTSKISRRFLRQTFQLSL